MRSSVRSSSLTWLGSPNLSLFDRVPSTAVEESLGTEDFLNVGRPAVPSGLRILKPDPSLEWPVVPRPPPRNRPSRTLTGFVAGQAVIMWTVSRGPGKGCDSWVFGRCRFRPGSSS